MADASAEHARLACAVTGVNAPIMRGPCVANATTPPKPAAKISEQSGGSGENDALKRIEKAIAAVAVALTRRTEPRKMLTGSRVDAFSR
eukprot:2733408-Prymnesium_polylepis.2